MLVENLETITNWAYLTYIWINKKLEYRFLVKTAKTENIILKTTSFPCKAAMSETNVKTNRMGSTKSTYKNNGVLPVTTEFYWKFYFSFRTSIKVLIVLMYQLTKCSIHTFCKRWSFN